MNSILVFHSKRFFLSHSYSTISKIQRLPSYLHHIGKQPLIYKNIGQALDDAAEKFGDREALVSCHENKRLTFNEIRDKSDELAAGLLKIGLVKGDSIAILSPNNIIWYLTMMAAARSGLILVALNPFLQELEIEYCIHKVGVKALIGVEKFRKQNYYEILKRIYPNLTNCAPGHLKSERIPSLQSIIMDSVEKLPGTFQFNEISSLANQNEIDEIQKNQINISPDSPCNIQFTSGTTGKPKATVLNHFGFVNNGYHVGNRNLLSPNYQRICVQVPLFHAYGVVISIMAGLVHGATLVLPSDGFDPVSSLNAIVNEKCTVIHGTPTMYVDLINHQRKLQLPIETAEIAVTGGSPCSPQLFKDIKKILGLKYVKTVFGMTENCAVSFQSLTGESEENLLNTVGHLTDHIEAKVIDSNGDIVPFGQPGELCIRGYFIMMEYFGDEEKTLETVGKDKWLRTGDQFILEENGYGRIIGRLKDLIIRGGENIAPKEVEDFLNSHPDIIEAHVIGVPDDRMGEEICAFIRLRDGIKSLEQNEIKSFFKEKIAQFKIPKYVKIIDDFPKTVSGKVMKFKLNEIYKNDK